MFRKNTVSAQARAEPDQADNGKVGFEDLFTLAKFYGIKAPQNAHLK